MIPGIMGNLICKLSYILEYKPRILGGFYKAKVEGLAYIQVYAPSEKNYIINTHIRNFFQPEILHVM